MIVTVIHGAKYVAGTKVKDRTGERHGRLTVAGYAGKRGEASAWDCLCDCGNRKTVLASIFYGSIMPSCGCYLTEQRPPAGIIAGLKAEELAYIAGIFDGEGCFYIYRKAGGSGKAKSYRSAAKANNTHLPLMEWLASKLGGRINARTPKQTGYKTIYQLCVEGPRLVELVDSLLPYMIVKNEQALVAKEMQLTMLQVRTGLPLDQSLREKRDGIYRRFIQAKHGPSCSWGGRKLA